MAPQDFSGDDRHTDTITDLGSLQALLHLGRGPDTIIQTSLTAPAQPCTSVHLQEMRLTALYSD